MRDIPPRVSEEQLPWVQVKPYHPHKGKKSSMARSLPVEAHAMATFLSNSLFASVQ